MLIRHDAVTKQECETIIDSFNRCRFQYTHAVPGDDFFSHRVMWFNSYPRTELAARQALRRLQDQAIGWMERFFQEPRLYIDGIQTVLWPPDVKMTPHQDDRHPDGAPHNTPWRSRAFVYYLNDDYAGGEIFFPDQDYTFKPKQGDFIGFPGDWWHGVNAPSAARYTVIAWCSKDIIHRDPHSIEPI